MVGVCQKVLFLNVFVHFVDLFLVWARASHHETTYNTAQPAPFPCMHIVLMDSFLNSHNQHDGSNLDKQRTTKSVNTCSLVFCPIVKVTKQVENTYLLVSSSVR
ncbi:hypothetical protein XELAEV_18025206mg [Xenopus laevis]|uniref:Secreted protein n=1 Tax=Xenopus laevis TaxID=8355 RepID=A0A974D1S5_XENLA|nr:hypothetical protein XELAEV_18025206mg [Xenopus laevis]